MTHIRLRFIDGKTSIDFTSDTDFITFAKKFFKQSVYYVTPSEKGNRIAIDTDKVMIMEEVKESGKKEEPGK